MFIDASRRRQRRLEAAQGYLMLDLPDRALHELNGIDQPCEAAFDVHLLRGEALRAKRDHRRSLASFRLAHAAQPDHLGALMGMAWCHKRLDELEQSIEAMKLAYQAHPKEPVVLYNLACYYSLAGEKDQALSWLGRALRMDLGLKKLIPQEDDFNSLRDDPDFQHLLELVAS